MSSTSRRLLALLEEGVQLSQVDGALRIRAPRGVMTPALQESLRQSKEALLELLQPGQKITPLSFGQRRFWFLARLDPQTAAENIAILYRLRGPLDVRALRRTLERIAERHDLLRGRFLDLDGRPAQLIEATGGKALRIDLHALPKKRRRAEAQRQVRRAAFTPFDLATGPLMRALLFELSAPQRGRPAAHQLFLGFHHVVVDAASLELFESEITPLYEAEVTGRPAALSPSAQYADFAVHQLRHLRGENLERLLDFWRHQLEHPPQTTALPTDRPRPRKRSWGGKSLPFLLPEPLPAALRALGTACRASPFMVLLAAYFALLQRLSGQNDLVVGTPMTGRSQGPTDLALEGMIGFFIDMLPLRGQPHPKDSFRRLVHQVRDTALSAFAHQELPFEKLVEELRPNRDGRTNPLFQVAFALQRLASQPPLLPAPIEVEKEDLGLVHLRFDLDLHIWEGPEGLSGLLHYDTDLFDATTAARIAHSFRHLLTTALERPDATLGALPWLDPAAQHQLLVEWNRQPTRPPECNLLPEHLDTCAATTPHSIALTMDDRHTSRGELQRRATALAHRLRALGAVPEARIAVLIKRREEMVIALLAVLKSGAAYLPLAPDDPPGRLADLLDDAAPLAVLTTPDLHSKLPPSVAVLEVTAQAEAAPSEPQTKIASLAAPHAQNAAYVLYTSGSTGKPKAVVVSHGSLMAYLRAAVEAYGLDADAAVPLHSPPQFDLSVTSLWGPLVAGGSVVLADIGHSLSQNLATALRRARRFRMLKLTPTHLELLTREGNAPDILRHTENLVVGGEALRGEQLCGGYLEDAALCTEPPTGQEGKKGKKGRRLINEYGPTEATVACALYATARVVSGDVPIGRPLGGARLYVLDTALRPVFRGAAGELGIAGPGLARGYAGRPRATAECFVPDPFTEPRTSLSSTCRLYKTGDRVRQRPDGQLEILGRVDHQIKVRGIRVEPAEVEAVLREHPLVQETAVVLRPLTAEETTQHLVAFVAAAGRDLGPELDGLSEFLRARLPAAMVPAPLVPLDSLPLTPSGKLDRRALTQHVLPESSTSTLPRGASDDPRKEILVALWSRLLGRPQAGPDDHFFELGGHSLLATRLISRVRQIFRVELPLETIFDHPTPAAFADALARHEPAGRRSSSLLCRRLRPRRPPLSFAQQRLWFLHQMAPQSAAYHMPEAFLLRGPLDIPALEAGLQHIVVRHEVLRTTFPVYDGQPYQHVASPTSLAPPLPEIDLSGLPGTVRNAEVKQLIHREARRPFDLVTGPLHRCSRVRLGDEEHLLLFNQHHIISDGWSVEVFFTELSTLYGAFERHRPPEPTPGRPPELPVQYVDFTLWQRQWLADSNLAELLTFWRRQLDGAPALALPTDRPRRRPRQTEAGAGSNHHDFDSEAERATTPAASDRGAWVPVHIGPETTAGLRRLSISGGASLFMGLMTVFTTLLARLSGQLDIVVGSPVANRRRQELEPLIGFFVNALVLRLELDDNPTFPSLLERLRRTVLAAWDHQDLPFERLVEELNPERDPTRNPLFQTTLALTSGPPPAPTFPGITVEPCEIELRFTRFDLELHLWQVEGHLRGFLVYNTGLFDPTTAQRWAASLKRLTGAIADQPEYPLGEQPLLAPSELHQVRVEWNDTGSPHPAEDDDASTTPHGCALHHRFEAQVARTPDAIALDTGEHQLSYRQLDRRSTALARRLCSLGVGPEIRVGVLMSRRPELMETLLAVLKAGGAYLPLDPTYPQKRLGYMLENAHVKVLVTEQALLASLPSYGTATVLCADRTTDRKVRGRKPQPTTAQNPAYVLFTSGSTGQPKGVVIPHGAIVHHMAWMQGTMPLTENDAVLQKTPMGFDASIWEFWAPLEIGARLVLAPPGRLEARALIATSERHRITILQVVPTLLRLLLAEADFSRPPIRRVLCGGEALDSELFRRFLHCTQAELWNVYGPSEATIHAASAHLQAGERNDLGEPPIGRPIANAQVHVLDRGGHVLPPGAVGELHIHSPGLARGYLARPGITAERFRPNRWGAEPGSRLYRTGDRVRFRTDGQLDFLGRLDHQVKVRGFRIELGEIEHAMQKHPLVHQVLVTARSEDQNTRLVAYVVPAQRSDRAALEAEHVDRWETLYESIYRNSNAPNDDATFDIVGWTSSYTDRPIPAAEMREWLEHTVRRILQLAPRKVLELGCGTGMLLFRIAPSCRRYLATDLSPAAVHGLRRRLATTSLPTNRVKVRQQPANDFSGLETGTFDTVVLSSVVQYFPSVEYLLSVLRGAVRATESGGRLFLGDIRSLPLLHVFYVTVEQHRAAETLSIDVLRRRVEARARREKELVITPAFFLALPRLFRRLVRVWVRPKEGQADNELSRFRYDVSLFLDNEGSAGPAVPEDTTRLVYSPDFDLQQVRHRLDVEAPKSLTLQKIPAAAWEQDFAPERLHAFLRGLPYTLEFDWQRQGQGTLVLRRSKVENPEAWHLAAESFKPIAAVDHGVEGGFWALCANRPLEQSVDRQLVPELRELLTKRLPEYMVPSFFVLLETFPLTPSGKVDRRHLPAPSGLRPQLAAPFTAPRNTVEKQLALTWSDVLGVEGVGVFDNFFELGGHSLLATQVISRLRHLFGVEVPLRELFERPTITGLAEAVVRARKHHGQVAASPPLMPVSRHGRMPLSFAQQRLWFLDRLEPGNPAYGNPEAFDLNGELHPAAMADSMARIARRHEVLRTTFPSHEGQPHQHIAAFSPPPLPLVDLTALPPRERQFEARRLTYTESCRPFDLAHGPLWRTRLLRLTPRRHRLLLHVHHILWDGWSQGVFQHELATLYAAALGGEPSALPRLSVQYADFADWQRRWLKAGALERQLAYWKCRLGDAPPPLELPTDRPRPQLLTHRGGERLLRLAPAAVAPLRNLANRSSASMFMTLLALYATLLHRASGRIDLLVGTPVAGRNRAQIEPLIGFFVNSLVLRLHLDGQPTFRELLARVRETALEAFAHQDLPFEKLVEELAPQRDTSRNPLFQLAFALQNTPQPQLRLPGLTVKPVDTGSHQMPFDLSLDLTEVGDAVEGSFSYLADLFDATTIERRARQLECLVTAAGRDPDRPLSSLPLLDRGASHQVVAEWSWKAPTPSFQPVHTLVLQQSRKRPATIALVAGHEHLSYGMLTERVVTLAQLLRRHGVKREMLVALHAGRHLESMTNLLAILAIGAAYLPIDPGLPTARKEFLLREAGASFFVSGRSTAGSRRQHEGMPTRILSDLEPTPGRPIDPQALEALAPIDPRQLAYALFTSGTGGRPKAVLVPHGALGNHTLDAADAYGLASEDRVLQFAALSFDTSAEEIFPTLISGATLVLRDDSMLASTGRFLRAASRFRLTVLDLPTAFWHELCAEFAATVHPWPRSVRSVILGGERAQAKAWRVWSRRVPAEVALWNSYGPTEGTVVSTRQRLPAEALGEPRLGRPICGVEVRLLDRTFKPVPPGTVGELFLGGAGLARGYHRQPALTAQSFRPDPWGRNGERLYATGDLARWSSVGILEYIGRRDDQIKLRGIRVEPAEIEAALRRHPAVREAAVVVRHTSPGDLRLVAWVVPTDDAANALEASELRRWLARRLPTALVPAAVLLNHRLPLTAHGKVDRTALAALALDAEIPSGPPGNRDLPRNATERDLLELWQEILGEPPQNSDSPGDPQTTAAPPLGINDDFFTRGGHSLLAVRLMSRIERRFGVDLALADLFHHSTVATLAGRIAERRIARHLATDDGKPTWRAPLVTLEAGEGKPPLFCVHPAGGHVACYVPLARHLGPDQPFYALQAISGSHDEDAGSRSVPEMASAYLQAVRERQPSGPYHVAGWSLGGTVAYEMARQIAAEGGEIALVALIDAGLAAGRGAANLRNFAGVLGLPIDELDLPWEELERQPLRERISRLRTLGAELSPLLADLKTTHLYRLYRLFEGNIQALEGYRPKPYSGKVLLFRPTQEIEAAAPDLGWGKLAQNVELLSLPGDHFSIVRDPGVRRLAAELRQRIAGAAP